MAAQAAQASGGQDSVEWSFQSMSARNCNRKVLAKKNGNPVAWRLMRRNGEDTYISYPTWHKHATEDELQTAFDLLETERA